ncbi:hypothetical protein EDB81DRAFT_832178 [Dactylonectria macrodidyma]|uniref:Uncharacterized protein n=1 Tax=Dactylonectria macrodidyma TaxID=307937 RepID=A0A9P9I7W0_9HYPO|nr:hypothetical protein EDB81DRAFT_832178 [Dactylonectria macrodidyma]
MPFSCQHAGCSRAYLRKEHLTRHMRSHERPKEFTCAECGSKLSRMDTFRRHMAMHGSTLPSVRTLQACLPCRRAKMKCDGQEPTCSGCSARSSSCVWPGSTNRRSRNPEHSAFILPASVHVSTEPTESRDGPECYSEDDPCGLTHREQDSMALTAPASECPGKLAMYDRLIAVYFDKFHQHWPIVHEKSIRLRRAPQVLVKTVVTIGLYLTENVEAKNMAEGTLESYLHQSGNTLASFLTLGEAGQLFPDLAHLLEFQAILLQAIMIPRLTAQGLATGIMIDSMLSSVLMLAGVYDQSRIDTANINSDGWTMNPAVLRESYQR